MKLNCETILDFYTHKNKKIICQIKVLTSKNQKSKNTCRCLTQEQWNIFDKELEKLIDNLSSMVQLGDKKSYKFKIKPNIEVKIKKSKLSLKNLEKCLGETVYVDKNESEEARMQNIEQIIYILECVLDCQQEASLSKSIEIFLESSQDETLYSPLSWELGTPSKEKSQADSVDTIKTPGRDFLDYKYQTSETFCETIPEYKPTPIKKKRSLEGNDESDQNEYINHFIVETDDEIASPKKFEGLRSNLKKYLKKESEYVPKNQEIALIEAPTYIPTPINEKNKKDFDNKRLRSCSSKKAENHISSKNQHFGNENNEKTKNFDENIFTTKEKEARLENTVKGKSGAVETTEKKFSTELLQVSKKSSKKQLNASGNEDKLSLKADKNLQKLNNREKSTLTTPESTVTDLCQSKNVKENYVLSEICLLRRSERSPIKPKRFIEEQSESSNKSKNHKYSKNKELFGSDDDDDDEDFETKNADNNNNANALKTKVFQTPVSKKLAECSTPTSFSSKQKRKRDKSSDCEQEKRDIDKWLCKKKSSSNHSAATSSKSPPPTTLKNVKSLTASNFEIPSREELEEIRCKSKLVKKENEKRKAELDKLSPLLPKEVDILSLQNMTPDDMLGTFSTYKSDLDKIYEKNRKKDHINSHNGINHCFVSSLLQQNVQTKMLEKLTDVYINKKSTTQATLYANALLPEWIIRVYMKKFDFTREQAIQQIRTQEDYQLYMEEQNDTSFMFD